MTLEQKKLVVREICARMPYGIRVQFGETRDNYTPIVTNIDFGNGFIMSSAADPYMILRNLSSMTEEEKKEYFELVNKDIDIASDAMEAPILIEYNSSYSSGIVMANELEFMYRHHFDFPRRQDDGSYKTLTELGLAIEDNNSAYKNYKPW